MAQRRTLPRFAIALAGQVRTLSLALIEKAERNRGGRYDWVIRTRPDIWMACGLQPVTTEHIKLELRGDYWASYRWDYF